MESERESFVSRRVAGCEMNASCADAAIVPDQGRNSDPASRAYAAPAPTLHRRCGYRRALSFSTVPVWMNGEIEQAKTEGSNIPSGKRRIITEALRPVPA